ncbi:AraC family transcriptional regulator [Granulicella cerasi]|uniref:AraC family transcriptional regulator n=1 Tax=Granulicella cerasi TaxID=741063 RepID=A0ABW1ZFA0_9BACT|nr:AraC family transcriptional regulator [Granulicella cerasi]
MDPLSEVLALLKVHSLAAGAYGIAEGVAIQWPYHGGIKCYAIASGSAWLELEGHPEPIPMAAGDCFILPPGPPFCIATDLSLPRVDFMTLREQCRAAETLVPQNCSTYMLGGHFALQGKHAELLLGSLPPVIHIRNEDGKAAMRWSLERMRNEAQQQDPGSALITQQLAFIMLIEALRLHFADDTRPVKGWLAALADPQMGAAIAAMHERPHHCWTLESLASEIGMSRSVFAQRFKQTVGLSPMEYLTEWRMQLAADKLQRSRESLAEIAASLGYESASAFGKAFKRVMGFPPRQYQRA